MSTTRELLVPDIGDFKDVPILEVFIKTGDALAKDAPVITMESDKATLDVPSDLAGTVAEVRVKPGDRVSQGSVLAVVTVGESSAASAPATTSAPPGTPRVQTAVAQIEHAGIREITVPDIGEFKDVPIIDLLIAPGDAVVKDAPLLTLESDKATLDVPAPFSGTIIELRVKAGDRVSAGAVVATASTDVAAPAPPAARPAIADPKPMSAPLASTVGRDMPSSYGASGGPATGSLSNGAINGASRGGSHASPSIRKFARELGVQIGGVRGTGPNGRITREDVQGWVKRALSNGAGSNGANHFANGSGNGSGLHLAAWPKVDFAAFGPVERTPLTRIQKLSGPYLHRNWVMIPHVTHQDDADVTELEALRKSINAEQSDAKVTMLAFLMAASVAALKKFPTFNSSLDGEELVRKQYFHIGFAADTPQGLVVPVIRDADRKGVLQIARETAELAKKARDGKLGASEMQGGTFTISSLGGIGGTAFTPIINAPEVAILGVTKAAIKPVWDGTAFQPRLILPLSLSYDHRVIDGASAARFCVALTQTLGDLRRALL